MSDISLHDLEDRIGVVFNEGALLKQALTHRTVDIEHHLTSNERLEFIGDAIINFVVGEHLYLLYPEYAEGELAKTRAYLVSQQRLADAARSIDLQKYVLIGVGEHTTGLSERASVLSDMLEALVAAVYLDQGIDAARLLTIRLLKDALSQVSGETNKGDYKSALQEQFQAAYKNLPVYKVVSERGDAHDKTFVIEVLDDETVIGTGYGKSKRAASQAAAKAAIEQSELHNR